jgi:hypothetical protein
VESFSQGSDPAGEYRKRGWLNARHNSAILYRQGVYPNCPDGANYVEQGMGALALDDAQNEYRRYDFLAMTVYETTNHNTIFHWATSQKLWPACVKGSPDRIRLGGDRFAPEEEDLEPIEWWRWFAEFDRRNLMLVYDPSKGWFTLSSRLAPAASR